MSSWRSSPPRKNGPTNDDNDNNKTKTTLREYNVKSNQSRKILTDQYLLICLCRNECHRSRQQPRHFSSGLSRLARTQSWQSIDRAHLHNYNRTKRDGPNFSKVLFGWETIFIFLWQGQENADNGRLKVSIQIHEIKCHRILLIFYFFFFYLNISLGLELVVKEKLVAQLSLSRVPLKFYCSIEKKGGDE